MLQATVMIYVLLGIIIAGYLYLGHLADQEAEENYEAFMDDLNDIVNGDYESSGKES